MSVQVEFQVNRLLTHKKTISTSKLTHSHAPTLLSVFYRISRQCRAQPPPVDPSAQEVIPTVGSKEKGSTVTISTPFRHIVAMTRMRGNSKAPYGIYLSVTAIPTFLTLPPTPIATALSPSLPPLRPPRIRRTPSGDRNEPCSLGEIRPLAHFYQGERQGGKGCGRTFEWQCGSQLPHGGYDSICNQI